MKLAAIDIGSNAIRLLIEEARSTDNNGVYFKKISLTRVPLRLGEDVFSKGSISVKKQEQLVKSMMAFKYLMEVYEVNHYRAVATSAMREAKNGNDTANWVKGLAGIDIEIIPGQEEADLIFSNFFTQKKWLSPKKTYLYIDVGGGSTELTLIQQGKRVVSESFKIGTVRLLKGKVSKSKWAEMYKWVKRYTKGEQEIVGIGTGGNINRIFKESTRRFQEKITYSEVKQVADYIGGFSLEDRVRKLKLKPDRADVIIPASEIYLGVMEQAKIKEMYVPKVGLSDGIVYNLYKTNFK